MGLVFAREPLAMALESGLEPLLRAHWTEVGHNRDVIALDPDWDGYLDMERRGLLFGWTLRRDGDLAGYTAFFVTPHLHYRGAKFAINDVIYLRPGERGIEGLRMILKTEEALKAMSVAKVFYHTKSDAILGLRAPDSLAAIEDIQAVEEEFGIDLPDEVFATDHTLGGVLAALGYRHTESQFGKLLKENG